MHSKAYCKKIQNPYVSVIVPVYNEESCIKDCILSLLDQGFEPLEILVVDDGSTDNSVEICENLKIKVFKQDHKGPGAARNLGARYAKGNILVLIDADMVFSSDYISKMVEPIIKGEAITTSHWDELVLNWENRWARCQSYDLGLPEKRRQPSEPPEGEAVYRAVLKNFFLDYGGHSEDRGRGEDIAIFERTGVKAKIVRNTGCYHRNLGNVREVLIHSLWSGKNVAVESNKRFRKTLVSILYNNPFKRIIKGIVIGLKKKEPYMLLYELIYSIGFSYGAIYSFFTKNHHK